jgi:hypothetical protein
MNQRGRPGDASIAQADEQFVIAGRVRGPENTVGGPRSAVSISGVTVELPWLPAELAGTSEDPC